MKHIYTARKDCRVCWGPLKTVWDLGLQYIYSLEANNAAPLELCICQDCELVQLRHTVNPDHLYKGEYYYKSGINDSMRAALKDVVESAGRHIDYKAGDVVVDIGANDGTLLNNYGTNITTVAFEPSKIAENINSSRHIRIVDYFNERAYYLRIDRRAKIVTACAMFYDIDDPVAFLTDIHKCLADDGIFIIQMNYLKSMIENNTFDSISHEHLIYYNIKDVVKLCARVGLVVIDAQLNKVNGGSVRLYIQKSIDGRPDGKSDRLRDYLEYEDRFYKDSGLSLGKIILNMAETCMRQCNSLKDFARTHKVCVLGASTRGYVILQYAGITDEIESAIDRNPEKVGRSLGNMVIKDELAIDDYRYALVLPYHFIDEMRARYKPWLERGGTLIRPLPEFELVEHERDQQTSRIMTFE